MRKSAPLSFAVMLGIFFFCLLTSIQALALENPGQVPELPFLILPETTIGENTFRREVFSLKELREGNVSLLERIFATRMDFPLMFEPQSEFAAGFLSDSLCMRFGKNFSVVLNLYKSCWPEDGLPALAALKQELAKQGLDREPSDTRLSVELMTFLRNYDILRAYIGNYPGISEEGRQEMLKAFAEMQDACRNVVEFKALTLKGIKSVEEIDASARQVADSEEKLRFEPIYYRLERHEHPRHYSQVGHPKPKTV